MSFQLVLHPVACLAAGAALLLGHAGCSDHAPRYRAQLPERHQQPVVAPGKILFVLSAADEQVLQNGKRRATGNFLGELYEPYAALTKAGYAVEVATPGGRQPSLDPESLNDKYWGDHPELRAEAKALLKQPGLTRPLSLAAAVEAEHSFQGMLIPGGQGLMVDLLNDLRVHSLIQRFVESDRPVGLICHAPALLTRIPASQPLSQRRVTSVSGFEEFYIETFVMGGKAAAVRGIGDMLEAKGYQHLTAFPGRSHALGDCNLVTSQNPFSGHDFTRLFLAALHDHRRGARCVPSVLLHDRAEEAGEIGAGDATADMAPRAVYAMRHGETQVALGFPGATCARHCPAPRYTSGRVPSTRGARSGERVGMLGAGSLDRVADRGTSRSRSLASSAATEPRGRSGSRRVEP